MARQGESQPDESSVREADDQDADAQPAPRASEPGRESPREGQPGAQPNEEKKSAAERLREWQQRRQQAKERRRLAERARDAARRMSEDMSENERREWLDAWRDMLARDRDPGGAGDRAGDEIQPRPETPREPFEATPADFDLGDDELARELIAEWLDEDAEAVPTGTSPSSTTSRATRARRAAERAVEDSTLPTRYHEFIKRYFGRLPGEEPGAERAPAGGATSGGATSGGGGGA